MNADCHKTTNTINGMQFIHTNVDSLISHNNINRKSNKVDVKLKINRQFLLFTTTKIVSIKQVKKQAN